MGVTRSPKSFDTRRKVARHSGSRTSSKMMSSMSGGSFDVLVGGLDREDRIISSRCVMLLVAAPFGSSWLDPCFNDRGHFRSRTYWVGTAGLEISRRVDILPGLGGGDILESRR